MQARRFKDIYHEFISGKIDTPEKYEAHREEMAETGAGLNSVRMTQRRVALATTDAMEEFEHRDAAKCTPTAKRTTKRIDWSWKASRTLHLKSARQASFDNPDRSLTKTRQQMKVVYPVTDSIAMGDAR